MAHRILEQQMRFAQALGAGGKYIRAVQFVEQVGAYLADDLGGSGSAQHDHRDPKMRKQIYGPFQGPGRVHIFR